MCPGPGDRVRCLPRGCNRLQRNARSGWSDGLRGSERSREKASFAHFLDDTFRSETPSLLPGSGSGAPRGPVYTSAL